MAHMYIVFVLSLCECVVYLCCVSVNVLSLCECVVYLCCVSVNVLCICVVCLLMPG